MTPGKGKQLNIKIFFLFFRRGISFYPQQLSSFSGKSSPGSLQANLADNQENKTKKNGRTPELQFTGYMWYNLILD